MTAMKTKIGLAVAIAALCASSGAVRADDRAAPALFGDATVLNSEDLAGGRARGADLMPHGIRGVLGDNTALGDGNIGENGIGGSAFSNAAGFATVIQNTGNNVLIQQQTIVDVRIH